MRDTLYVCVCEDTRAQTAKVCVANIHYKYLHNYHYPFCLIRAFAGAGKVGVTLAVLWRSGTVAIDIVHKRYNYPAVVVVVRSCRTLLFQFES